MTSLTQVTGAEVRAGLVRRGLQLGYTTVLYNSLEALIALVAGVVAGSVALVGFGADSVIEVTAGVAALWRLGRDVDPARRQHAERLTLRIVGLCFLALAVYITWDSLKSLIEHEAPRESVTGIVLAAASLVVMPLLARAKRKVALAMGSGALVAEAKQTALCTWLSAILLGGLLLNAVLGWWWADPVAALAMVPIIAREGWEGIRGRSACADDCCQV
ncbi:MAG TPA: cation transporter [Gemmatimonadales bacterium]|nr:cation transporter [Gemmatimonadales bacterium]